MANEFVGWGGWSSYVKSNGNSLIQTCGNETIFGGYGKFGYLYPAQKKFANLPSHSGFELTLRIYFVDSWDGGSFTVTVDSSTVVSQSSNVINHVNYICGNSSHKDRIISLQTTGYKPHTSSSMTLYFNCGLDEGLFDESWGIKNLNLYLYNNCPLPCITCDFTGSCLTCPSFAELNGSTCVCMDNFYLVSSPYTRCEKCDISCKTCDGGTSSDCLSCYIGDTLVFKKCQTLTS